MFNTKEFNELLRLICNPIPDNTMGAGEIGLTVDSYRVVPIRQYTCKLCGAKTFNKTCDFNCYGRAFLKLSNRVDLHNDIKAVHND